jgi:hypothetical protein
MWIPESEQEILTAIDAGDLVETASFDAKLSLPDKGKSKDLAIDVAAMANDGGTLLYGVGEDENDRLTVPQPFSLAGVRERVDQIVRTTISEPPEVQVREIQTDDDSSLGYLVVVVPPSPRAPHMVTVGKEYRYYGRADTGNVLHTEGEVARLYEWRQRWEVDHDATLNEAIDSAPIEPQEDLAYLHLVARPVVPDEDLFDTAKGDQVAAQFLTSLFSATLSAEVFSTSYSPDLHSQIITSGVPMVGQQVRDSERSGESLRIPLPSWTSRSDWMAAAICSADEPLTDAEIVSSSSMS